MSKLRNKLADIDVVANEEQIKQIEILTQKLNDFETALSSLEETVNEVYDAAKVYGGEIERVVGGMIAERFIPFLRETYTGTQDFSFNKINEVMEKEKLQLQKWRIDSLTL